MTDLEFQPEAVVLRRRWRPDRGRAVGVLLIGFLVIAFAQPWGLPEPAGSEGASSVAVNVLASLAPDAPDTVALRGLIRAPGDPLVVAELVPADVQAQARAGPVMTSISQALVVTLVHRAHGWGVGVGGSGPRLIRDDPWTAWAAIRPVQAGSGPLLTSHVAMCEVAASLPDGARLVAVTVPDSTPPGWRVVGWWLDDVYAVSLEPLIRQVPLGASRTVIYLERLDAGRWPDGRYELHVTTRGRVLALTFCLGPG
jgi:hypothetical protein